MFLGHVNDFEEGTYTPIEQLDNKYVLIKANGRYNIVSNVCPHQKSIISVNAGKGNRVCPYHNWSFTLEGAPIKSGRTEYYCKNETALEELPVYEWNGFLSTVPIACKELEFVDLTNLKLVEKRIDPVSAIPENIMDLFLDVDHIATIHAGVYEQIGLPNIDKVEWVYYDHGSLQLVQNHTGYGAAWLAIYPGTMIEWQPGAVFITIAIRNGVNSSKVVVYKYKDLASSDKNYSLNQDVWETAWAQDKEQSQMLTEFAQTNLEESKYHFRSFLNR